MAETLDARGLRSGADACPAALVSLLIFHASLQALVIGWSLLRLPLCGLAALAVLATSAAAAYAAWRYYSRCPPASSREAATSGSRIGRGLSRAVVSLAVAVYITAWVVGFLRPDVSCDGNVYHIPAMHCWAAKGYVHWIDWPIGPVSHLNGFPKAVELLAFVVVTATGTSRLVNCGNLVLLPLGVLGVRCLAKALGAPPAASNLAAAAWVLLPMNVAQATQTYVDSGYASCVAAFLAMAVYAVLPAARDGGLVPFRAAVPLGAAAGLVMGAKGTGAAMVPIGFAAIAAAMLPAIVRRGPVPRAKRIAAAGALLLLAAAVALSVGGYWYARNYARTGSPLYPVGLRLGGHEIFPGQTVGEALGVEGCTALELRDRPVYQRVLLYWAQIGFQPHTLWACWPRSVWVEGGGLGFLWLAGCLPATLWLFGGMALRRDRLGLLTLSMLVVVVAAAFVVQPMNWHARLTIWLYAAGLPCFAVAAGNLCRPSAGRARLVVAGRVWLVACAAMLIVEGAFSLTRIVPIALRPQNTLASLERHYWGRPASYLMPELEGTVFDGIFRSGDGVAVGDLGGLRTRLSGRFKEEIVGQLSLPLGGRRIVRIEDPIDEAAARRLIASDVRHVILDEGHAIPEALAAYGFTLHRAPGFLVFSRGR